MTRTGVWTTPVLVIVEPFGQHRSHMLKLSIRDTAGCKHCSSEHGGVLGQLGEGAGLQGPDHLRTCICSCSSSCRFGSSCRFVSRFSCSSSCRTYSTSPPTSPIIPLTTRDSNTCSLAQ